MARLARLARFIRFVKPQGVLNRLKDLAPSSFVAMSLLDKIGILLFIAHWSACIWGFIGNPKKVKHPSQIEAPHDFFACEMGGPCEPGIVGSPWIRRYGFDSLVPASMPKLHLYFASLHFATGLVTGGSIGMEPGHWSERVFTIIMMILSFLVCSLVVSEIVVMLQKINESGKQHEENLRNITDFMKRRNVPLSLQAKIKRYLEFQHRSRTAGLEFNQGFVEQLSPWLQFELIEHLNGKVLARHPFLQELPPKVFKQICGIATAVLYAPGDIVMQRGHRATCMCFVVQGTLKVLKPKVPRSKKSQVNANHALRPQIMTTPLFLGDPCLFLDAESVRLNTVVALTHAELLALAVENFKPLIANFPKIQDQLHSWKTAYEAGKGVRCGICDEPTHCTTYCPRFKKNIGVSSAFVNIRARVSRELLVSASTGSLGQDSMGARIRAFFARKKGSLAAKQGDASLKSSSDGIS